MSRKAFQNQSPISRLRLLAGLLAVGLGVPALAQSVPFPTYAPGENTNASTGPTYSQPLPNPWVVSDGTIITPAGTQVYLGTTTRAKAIALNPTGNHTAAVLQMGAPQAVTIFNTQTGAVLQTYSAPYTDSKGETSYDSDGSTTGITYTPDGKYLLFSQDGMTSTAPSSSFVAIASVNPTTGLLSDYAQVSVPMDVNAERLSDQRHLLPTRTSPSGTRGPRAALISRAATPYSIFSDEHIHFLSHGHRGLAGCQDRLRRVGQQRYADQDRPDPATPVEGPEIRVGNVPHSVVISPDGKTAYVSNEAGRIATANDFQEYSNGTPVVAEYPTGTTATGTVSVVDLSTFTVTGSITTGLHPTGMAFWGKNLLVANAYSDSISVIDTTSNNGGADDRPWAADRRARRHPSPPTARGRTRSPSMPRTTSPTSRSTMPTRSPWSTSTPCSWNPVVGMIPVGYAPASVVLDTADNALLVANDKGIGTTGYGVAPPPTNTAENSYGKVLRRVRLQHPPGPWHRQHRPRAESLDPGRDDAAGLPE